MFFLEPTHCARPIGLLGAAQNRGSSSAVEKGKLSMTPEQDNIRKSLLCAGIVIFWGFIYYKILYHTPYFVSIDDAGTKTVRLFLQNVMVNIPVILMMIVALKRGKRDDLAISMPKGKMARIILLALAVIYVLLYVYAITVMEHMITASYMAMFYLLLVSFTEEFLYRGVLPKLLKNNAKVVRLLLPNILFALAHIVMLFVYDDAVKTITTSGMQIIISIFSSIVFGIIMELAKRKSGSLFVPVLLHAIYDFYGEIMLWL